MNFLQQNSFVIFNHKKGFTLIELLVVISIIGILSSVVLSSLNSVRSKARETRRISDIKQITNALFMLADSNGGNFPSTGGVGRCIGTTGTCWNGSISGDAALNTSIQQFLPTLPSDPSGRSGKGDRYVYADKNATVAWHCDGSPTANNGVPYPLGPYILWLPENTNPTNDSLCKNMGFNGCCGAAPCPPEGYFCAYKIQ